MNSALNIAILAYDGANAVDVFGPLQVFASANPIIRHLKPEITEAYCTTLIGIQNTEIRLATQTRVLCDGLITEPLETPIDTLLISGGEPAPIFAKIPGLTRRLLPVMDKARRVASICSGTFILAETGALAGRKATTHWDRYDEFSVCYPDTHLDIDALFTQDGKYYCSAGVTAGIDLALKLVEQDFGRRIALETAREMVVFYHRAGKASLVRCKDSNRPTPRHYKMPSNGYTNISTRRRISTCSVLPICSWVSIRPLPRFTASPPWMKSQKKPKAQQWAGYSVAA